MDTSRGLSGTSALRTCPALVYHASTHDHDVDVARDKFSKRNSASSFQGTGNSMAIRSPSVAKEIIRHCCADSTPGAPKSGFITPAHDGFAIPTQPSSRSAELLQDVCLSSLACGADCLR
jgi:hypothetical protein